MIVHESSFLIFVFVFERNFEKESEWFFKISLFCVFLYERKFEKESEWLFIISLFCVFFHERKLKKESERLSFLSFLHTYKAYTSTYTVFFYERKLKKESEWLPLGPTAKSTVAQATQNQRRPSHGKSTINNHLSTCLS